MKSLLKNVLVGVFSIAFVSTVVRAQNIPASAETVFKEAMVKASEQDKKIFILFQASWCGWCHTMERFMNDTSCEELFKNNYVVYHLAVKESDDKKHLENPGAEAMLEKYHGEKSGIPFWLIFDKNGNLLADSQIRPAGAGMNTPGQNVGCPSEPQEIAYFIKVLKETSSMNDQQLAVIKSRFSRK